MNIVNNIAEDGRGGRGSWKCGSALIGSSTCHQVYDYSGQYDSYEDCASQCHPAIAPTECCCGQEYGCSRDWNQNTTSCNNNNDCSNNDYCVKYSHNEDMHVGCDNAPGPSPPGPGPAPPGPRTQATGSRQRIGGNVRAASARTATAVAAELGVVYTRRSSRRYVQQPNRSAIIGSVRGTHPLHRRRSVWPRTCGFLGIYGHQRACDRDLGHVWT